MSTRDIYGSPVVIDPDDHDTEGEVREVPDPRGEVGPEAPGEPGQLGPFAKFFTELFATMEPKTKPGVIVLSDDEQAQRLVSRAALAEMLESFKALTKIPQRTQEVASTEFVPEQSFVDTVARMILSRQADRLRVTIYNRHASQNLFVGNGPELTVSDGFQVGAGESITLATSAPVWAIGSGAGTTFHLLTEFAQT